MPGYLATQKLLACGESFTALFSFNDVSAIGAIKALREAGLRMRRMSRWWGDDVQSAAFQNPALTTVRQPLRTMGVRQLRRCCNRSGRGAWGMLRNRSSWIRSWWCVSQHALLEPVRDSFCRSFFELGSRFSELIGLEECGEPGLCVRICSPDIGSGLTFYF